MSDLSCLATEFYDFSPALQVIEIDYSKFLSHVYIPKLKNTPNDLRLLELVDVYEDEHGWSLHVRADYTEDPSTTVHLIILVDSDEVGYEVVLLVNSCIEEILSGSVAN